MICILVFACVLFKQGETSQGTSEEKKMGIFNGQLAWVEPKMEPSKWCVSLNNTILNSTVGIS